MMMSPFYMSPATSSYPDLPFVANISENSPIRTAKTENENNHQVALYKKLNIKFCFLTFAFVCPRKMKHLNQHSLLLFLFSCCLYSRAGKSGRFVVFIFILEFRTFPAINNNAGNMNF
jgi:hypothetical protein